MGSKDLFNAACAAITGRKELKVRIARSRKKVPVGYPDHIVVRVPQNLLRVFILEYETMRIDFGIKVYKAFLLLDGW